MTTPAVGQEILSFCSKCRMNLWHIVVAKIGLTVKKVQCKTCKTQHNYKAPADERVGVHVDEYSAASSPPPHKAASSQAPKERKKRTSSSRDHGPDPLWVRMMEKYKEREHHPYDVMKPFKPGMLISHPVFGEGIVYKDAGGMKIEVLFKIGLKTLIHGMDQQEGV